MLAAAEGNYFHSTRSIMCITDKEKSTVSFSTSLNWLSRKIVDDNVLCMISIMVTPSLPLV